MITSSLFVLVLLSNVPIAASNPLREGDAVATEAPRLERVELDLWNDPAFKRRFTQSYLAETDVEPTVTLIEREDMEKVRKFMSEDRLDRAVELLKNKRGPTASAVFDFTLANIHFQQEDLERAAAGYETAVEKYPKFLRAWKNLGLVRVRASDFEAALPALTKVVELGGNDALNYGLLGYAYASTGNQLSAESAYRMALLLDPSTADWKLGLLRSLFEQRRYADAAALAAAMVAEEPGRADLWMLQGNAYLGLGQPQRAAENFELVDRLGGSTPYSLNKLGDIYYNQEVFGLSAQNYLKAFELDVEAGLDPLLQSTRRLIGRGALDEARGLVARMKELAPEQGGEASEGLAAGDEDQPVLDVERHKQLLKLEARIAVAEGAGDDEARVLEEIVRLDPLDGEALILLGHHASRAQDVERAAFWFERAEGLEDFEAEARLQHGRLLVGAGRYDEALPLLRRSQALRPRDSLAEYVEEVERIAARR